MNNVAKLIIAVALALGAAVLNAMWLSAEKRPPTFVAASTNLSAGTEISDAVLMPVPVPGESGRLRRTFIPYSNRAILYGLKSPRSYQPGDVFFQRDIQAPLEIAQYEVIGPFRLISVGSRFTEPTSESDDSRLGGGDNITIAIDADFDEKSRRLLEIIDPTRRVVRGGKVIRIVAIQVVPKEQSALIPTADSKNIVYQTISLSGIESVPRVLLEGDWIRFVVPAAESL